MDPGSQPTTRSSTSARWAYGVAAAAVLAAAGYFIAGMRTPDGQAAQSAHAQVERRAADRMAGVRCIGAAASPSQKEAIARMLAVDTVAPHGAVPAWLPTAFTDPQTGPAGSDAWQALSSACPDAPAFGTPFGFDSAAIERELRRDPEFAALADRQWAAIERYRAAGAQAPRK